MLFVVWTRRVLGTIDFVGAQIPPHWKGYFRGRTLAYRDLAAVDIFNVIRQGAGAMRLLATSLL